MSNIRSIDDPDLSSTFKTQIRKININQMTSDVLAAYIVAYKAIGIDKDFAVICMAELSRRRILGEEFNFEGFIEVELTKMPKIEHMDIVKISQGIKNNVEYLKEIVKK